MKELKIDGVFDLSDEEIAEEILQTKGSMTFCAKGCGYTEKVKELITIGLAEGRKESEKENEQLKCDLYNTDANLQHITIEYEKENAELKKQIDQLSNDNHVLKTAFITQKEQIEKMKNVGNCKHSMNCAKWNEKQTVLGLMKFCLNCQNWELAE